MRGDLFRHDDTSLEVESCQYKEKKAGWTVFNIPGGLIWGVCEEGGLLNSSRPFSRVAVQFCEVIHRFVKTLEHSITVHAIFKTMTRHQVDGYEGNRRHA